MIKLTWGEINNPVFLKAMQHLMNSRVLAETTIKLLTIARAINNEKTLVNMFLDKHKGNDEELKKGAENSFSIKVNPISSIHLREVKLSVGELLAIAPLLEDADDILKLAEIPGHDEKVQEESKHEIQKEAQA